jgi:hypothetical protein
LTIFLILNRIRLSSLNTETYKSHSAKIRLGIESELTVRVTLGEVMNPYMTGRMFIRFVKSNRAILIPKDFKGQTVLILDAVDSILLSEKLKKLKISDLKYEVMPQSFEEVLRQTDKALKDKKAFVIEQS